MSAPAVANLCQCCLEDCPRAVYDPVLGSVCEDCAAGVEAGTKNFQKLGLSGIFAGDCGDNRKT